eukprot:s6815_g5.t5
MLCGRDLDLKIKVTKRADAYPRRQCVLLSQAVAQDCGFIPGCRKLDIVHATAASRRVAEKGAAGAALKRTAWEMLTRWERLEPTKHRPPLPETVFEELGFSTLRLDSAGFCAASFSAPADALMTEYQSSSDGGLLRSAGNMLRKRGPAAFVRGWTANFCRHPCLMKPKVTRGSAF